MQQLLLIPLLAPLLAVWLVAAINPRPVVALRLLIWTSPALPLGLWIGGIAAAGAGLSAGATVLALRQQTPAADVPVLPRRDGPSPRRQEPAATGGGPSRAPGEPAPTVEVPFRVIRRGGQSQPAAQTTATAAPETVARAMGDGWDQPLNDSWD